MGAVTQRYATIPCFLLALLPAWLCAQSIPKEIDIDQFIQQVFQQQSEDINYEDAYESLYQYYTTPLNLNAAGREELQNLYVLSPLQIDHFLKHREENGLLLSIYELQVIPDFDKATFDKLLPFVIVENNEKPNNPAALLREVIQGDNTQLLTRYGRVLETKKGYETKKYLGSPDKLYLRFRSSHSKSYSLGFTMEKDSGEKNSWDPSHRTYGADFLSFHFALFNRKKLKSFVLGDYQLQFGQGLLLGAGYRFGKGAEPVTTAKRNNLGARPYTSVLETGYFRGAAMTYQLNRSIELTGFYSGKRMDGNTEAVDSLFGDYDAYVSSLQYSGYHRTASELGNKGVLKERIYGGNVSGSFLRKRLHLGITGLNTNYSLPVLKADKPYNLFEFSGTNNYGLGADYSLLLHNFNFFGEYARSRSGGQALVTGFISSLAQNVDVSFIYRNYERDFHTFYGKAFGENTRNINEQGIYWGIKIVPFSKWTVAAYYDRFWFPWLKYQVDAPSSGQEAMVRLTYSPAKKISLYGQFRSQEKAKNALENSSHFNTPEAAIKSNGLLHLDFLAGEHLAWKSRLQFSSYQQQSKTSYGYYLMQELSVNYSGIKASMRYALFDTDDYDNRQFAYEKDVLYAFSIPALYGKGVRFYLLTQFRISRNIDLWVKYAFTEYYNVTTIGSGLEEINGNRIDEVKVQVRWKL